MSFTVSRVFFCRFQSVIRREKVIFAGRMIVWIIITGITAEAAFPSRPGDGVSTLKI